jgi:hypothetical protein
MRIVAPLLKASMVAALVFTLAWVRAPALATTFSALTRIFIGYGLLIVILSLAIGFPLARVAERYRMISWWFSAAVASATGALLAAIFTEFPSKEIDNPFGFSFSPWTRDAPGFVGTDIKVSWADVVGSVTFGAAVGATLGIAFWYFYSRGTRLKGQP